MSLTSRAEGFAFAAHRGQVDKAGVPCIHHCRRVAWRFPPGSLRQVVGWLHDVIEDTSVTADDLLNAGFSGLVLDAVVLLTRTPGQSDQDYYAAIRADPLARAVKLADIADNSDPGRLALLDEATSARLVEKYDEASAALLGAEAGTTLLQAWERHKEAIGRAAHEVWLPVSPFWHPDAMPWDELTDDQRDVIINCDAACERFRLAFLAGMDEGRGQAL